MNTNIYLTAYEAINNLENCQLVFMTSEGFIIDTKVSDEKIAIAYKESDKVFFTEIFKYAIVINCAWNIDNSSFIENLPKVGGYAWWLNVESFTIGEFSITTDKYSKSLCKLITKNNFTFKLTKKGDIQDVYRLQYYFEVSDRVPNAQSILFGFCRKQKPAFEKILDFYPNADKSLYKIIDVDVLTTVITFLENLGEYKVSQKVETKLLKKKILEENYKKEIKERKNKEEAQIVLIKSRTKPGEPIKIENHREATFIYDKYFKDYLRVKKPKLWTSDSKELYMWSQKITYKDFGFILI